MERTEQPRLIVIADQFDEIRELLTQVFTEEFDAYVTPLPATSTLLDVVRHTTPNLIVLEVNSPEDLEIIRQLKESGKTQMVPVLGLTAWEKQLGCDALRQAGCNDCIPKPFNLNTLITKAEELLTV